MARARGLLTIVAVAVAVAFAVAMAGCASGPSDPLAGRLDVRAEKSCANGFGGWTPDVLAAADADMQQVREMYELFGVPSDLDPNLVEDASTYAAICWLDDPDNAGAKLLYYRLDDGRSGFIYRARE